MNYFSKSLSKTLRIGKQLAEKGNIKLFSQNFADDLQIQT